MKKAFTLLEIITVVIIVGVIVGIAIPNFSMAVEKTKAKEGEAFLINLLGAQKRYALDHGGWYTSNLADLDLPVSTTEYFELPQVWNPQGIGYQWTIGGVLYDLVASIRRKGNLYELGISKEGQIACIVPLSGDACKKMGYKTNP